MNRTSRSRPQLTGVSLWARFPICAEALERRVLLSTFTITNINDAGPGSLRQAILDADAGTGQEIIQFAIPGKGIPTIAPLSPLPVVTGTAFIGGQISTGAQQAPGGPNVELSGVNAGQFANGLVFAASAQGASVQGLIVDRFGGDGLVLDGSQESVNGCYIGTDATGSHAAGNGGNGVVLAGANTLMTQNVIGANGGSGILVLASGTGARILANRIGLNRAGEAALGNGTNAAAAYRDGITELAPQVTIGSAGSFALNVPAGNAIGGNKGNGIFVGRTAGGKTSISGNVIGTDRTGSLPIGNAADGIVLQAGNVSVGSFSNGPIGSLPTVTGANVIAANQGDGIRIVSSNNTVLHNYIGVNIVGAPLGNAGDGILIRGGSQNFIDTVNVISGNGGAGVSIQSEGPIASGAGNTLQGNLIGTDPTGTLAVGNAGNGVEVFASANTIYKNSIGANGGAGIFLGDAYGAPQSLNQLIGNTIGDELIGVNDRPRTAGLGNALDGVRIFRSSKNTISQNTIADNALNGVTVLSGSPAASDAIQNTISGNEIDSNGGLGIDLGGDGVTPNHHGSAAGPNNFQNYPVLVSARLNTQGTTVQFTLDSAAGAFRVEFFGDPQADPSGHGQGRQYIGMDRITVGTTPGVVYTAQVQRVPPGTVVTATATDNSGNTSEFALDVVVPQPPPLVLGLPSLNYGATAITLTYDFNEDVSTGLAAPALLLRNNQSGLQYMPTAVSYDAKSNAATFSLPGGLSPGIYTATLQAADIVDANGQHLDGKSTGTGGTDYVSTVTLVSPYVVGTPAVQIDVTSVTITFQFSRDMSASLTPQALLVRNLRTGTTYAPLTSGPRFVLPKDLPYGDYTATLLAADVIDAYGMHLNGGRDYVLPFSIPGPQVISYAVDQSVMPSTITFILKNDASFMFSPSALQIHDQDRGTDYTAISVAHNAATGVATFTLPELSGGKYAATLLAAGVVDASGTPFNGGNDYMLAFTAPTTRPQTQLVMGFSYLMTLVRNFGQTGTLAAGDLDGDRIVDFKDLVLLARNYGRPLSG